MGGQVIEHDNVAGDEGRGKDMCSPGCKGMAIDRALDHPWGLGAIAPHGGNHGRGLPAPAGNAVVGANAARSPGISARHVGLGTGFIHEQQARMADLLLRLRPTGSGHADVRAV